MTSRRIWLCANVGLCLVLQAGCGDDKEPAKRASDQSKDARAASGRGTSGAAGNGFAVPGLGAVPGLECDSKVESESSCGGTDCPKLPQEVSLSCVVTCCTANAKCGVRNTAIVAGFAVPNICVEQAVEDPRCPSTMLGGTTLPGCCDATGHCGQLYSTICLSSGVGVERACE